MGHVHPEKRRRITPPPAAAGSSPTIPDEVLISEVLVRLPVKSLMRFKCVRQSWCAAIADPVFVRRHLELSRARPPSMLVIPRKNGIDEGELSEDISFHRLRPGQAPGTVEAELMLEKVCTEGITCKILPTHCDGLIAVATTRDQVFVCNPVTQEFVQLPLGSRDVDDVRAPAAALGFDPWRNRYVVSRYFYRRYEIIVDEITGEEKLDYDIGHEVFTLGGDNWEPTVDPPHAIAPARPICTPGAFYWCADRVSPNALLRFSLRDESFDVVPCPPGADSDILVDHLTVLDGKLCYVLVATDTAMDVWMADDGPRPEWSLRCRIDLPYEEIGSDAFFPIAAGGDRMLVAVDYEKLYWYKERTKYLKEVVDMEELEYERRDGSKSCCELWPARHHVVPYVESLVSIRTCNY